MTNGEESPGPFRRSSPGTGGVSGLELRIEHVAQEVPDHVDAQMIISESALSFIGVGIPPPTPSWGGMLADGQNYLTAAWWVSTMPGLALMVTVHLRHRERRDDGHRREHVRKDVL